MIWGLYDYSVILSFCLSVRVLHRFWSLCPLDKWRIGIQISKTLCFLKFHENSRSRRDTPIRLLTNATTDFSFTWASYEFTKSNDTSLHWWLSTGKSARHTGRRKKLQVTLAEGRDPDDSVEINREKEHLSLGNQASSAVLLKQQCVPCRKKTPTCFHKPICLKLSRTWYVS